MAGNIKRNLIQQIQSMTEDERLHLLAKSLSTILVDENQKPRFNDDSGVTTITTVFITAKLGIPEGRPLNNREYALLQFITSKFFNGIPAEGMRHAIEGISMENAGRSLSYIDFMGRMSRWHFCSTSSAGRAPTA